MITTGSDSPSAVSRSIDILLRPRPSLWLSPAITTGGAGVASAALLIVLFLVLGLTSGRVDWPLLLFSDTWDYQQQVFGAAAMLWGTAVVGVIALVLALPLGWAAAVALNELTPQRWRRPLRAVVELLAAVPSIVYGLLGVALLLPMITEVFDVVGGASLLTAGLLLGVMVLPTIVSVSVDSLADVPQATRESAAALGLTRVEVISSAVLPAARGGMLGGGMLGLARALGETIAIYLVIGRASTQVPTDPGQMLQSILRPGESVTTKLGGPEPMLAGTTGDHWAALCAIGAVLLCVIALLTVAAQSPKLNRPGPVMPRSRKAKRGRAVRDLLIVAGLRVLLGLMIALALFIAWSIASRGTRAFSPAFWFTPTMGASGGGVRDQIIGTLLLIIVAGIVAAFLALALALITGEYATPRVARWLRTTTVALGGVPTILLGLAGFWFFGSVLGWGKSWLVGALLLGIVALPVVALSITTQLASLPSERRESAQALGLRRSQFIRSVLLPHTRPALVTGLLLGMSRAAGETAPLLFTATVFAGATSLPTGVVETPIVSLTTHIFTLGQDSADPVAMEAAWGAATVLLIIIISLLAATLPLRRRLERERS